MSSPDTPQAPPAVSVAGLEKRYGARRVLSGIDLEVGPDESIGLVGVNGAGKTTLIKCLLDLCAHDAGTNDLDADLREAPEETAEGGALLVDQALRHIERERSVNLDQTLGAWERAYIEAALRLTNGNVSQAAKLLGINRTTLYSRMSSASVGAPAQTKP